MTSQPPGRRPLTVAVAAVTYPPDVNGAANFAHRLSTGLARRGHNVHVICHATNGKATTVAEEGVTTHRLKSYATPVHPTFRVSTPWESSAAVNQLLAEIQPDIVHVQSHFFLGNAVLNAACRRGVPLVATNHFMPENLFSYIRVPRPLQRLSSWILWRTLIKRYGKARLVTAPTPRAVQLLRDNGFDREALAISCGIDVDRYRRRAEAYREQHPDPPVRTVLFVGRLDDEKHIDDLLRAMSLLRTETPTRLEIVGEGACHGRLQELAAELGIADRVHFAGLVSDDELIDAYARADVFCMPSIAELQSLATMEAMSAGTPVVLADAMALPHLVEQGENGWLYPPRDVHALAHAIDSIVGDRAMMDRMGAASERLVLKHDINAVLAQFESIYSQVIEQAGAATAEVRTELAS